MISVQQLSNGVYVAKDEIVTFGQDEVIFIKKQALLAPLKRARICAHKDNHSNIHEMLIALSSSTYVPPHKHKNKSESFHVVEGEASVFIFDDIGNVTNIIALDAKNNFFFRISEEIYHSLLIKSPFFVIHETTDGPFIPNTSINAPFAPCVDDPNAVKAYMKLLGSLI